MRRTSCAQVRSGISHWPLTPVALAAYVYALTSYLFLLHGLLAVRTRAGGGAEFPLPVPSMTAVLPVVNGLWLLLLVVDGVRVWSRRGQPYRAFQLVGLGFAVVLVAAIQYALMLAEGAPEVS